MGLTKAQLEALNDSSFPNNDNGAITPQILRDYNDATIANTVNQDDYTADSASFNNRIIAATGSVTSAITASSLITASFDNNTRNLTFTKGDATTFAVNIPDVSGSTLNTGSLLLTASVNLNTITFTKADGTTFPITVDTGSGGGGGGTISVQDEGSILGNATSFNFTGAGVTATLSAGTASITIPGGGGSIDTGSFATTGSNTFRGNQDITTTGNTQLNIISTGGGQANLDFQASNSNFRAYGQFNITNNGQYGGSGSIKVVASNNQMELAADSGVAIGPTNGGGNAIGTGAIRLLAQSGSLVLTNNSYTNTSASLSHLSASDNTTLANFIFKANNNTGTTIISGSNNIFTNPATPTTGYIRYIGGANNIYLNSSNGVTSQITASAISVSGNRPTMNNNIFANTGDFLINQAVNPGTHTYSGNIFGGVLGCTINAMAFTGSLTMNNNINTSTITINAASASFNEITGGFSGSHSIIVSNNNNQGTITITTNRNQPPNINQFYQGNIVNGGGGLTITNHSSSAAVSAQNNIAIGQMNYSNAGAAGLGLHRTGVTINTNYGALTLIASASAISATNNISPNAMSVTNRMYSGSFGSGSLTYNNNQIQGALNTYVVSGSYNGTGTGPVFSQTAVFGSSNTFFTNVEGRGNYVSFASNTFGGANLIFTGSQNNVTAEVGGAHFGRYNANDGIRNTTGENIFSVGTGVSGSRKTGFLIDSGSNTFVEGTFNVSGSTSLTGSLTIQSGSAFFANGNRQFNVGAFSSLVTQSGSANVSQSMNFEVTDISNGVSIASNSRITLANSGTYNIQFSAQVDRVSGSGTDTVHIWLKKNGTNVTASAGSITISGGAAAAKTISSWNYVVDATAGDYYELVWEPTDANIQLIAAAATGNIPSIPSVILTVTQVR